MASKKQLRRHAKAEAKANSTPRPRYTDEELDYLIDEWHCDTNNDQSLGEYLGWTDAEYARWVETCKQPEE